MANQDGFQRNRWRLDPMQEEGELYTTLTHMVGLAQRRARELQQAVGIIRCSDYEQRLRFLVSTNGIVRNA